MKKASIVLMLGLSVEGCASEQQTYYGWVRPLEKGETAQAHEKRFANDYSFCKNKEATSDGGWSYEGCMITIRGWRRTSQFMPPSQTIATDAADSSLESAIQTLNESSQNLLNSSRAPAFVPAPSMPIEPVGEGRYPKVNAPFNPPSEPGTLPYGIQGTGVPIEELNQYMP